MELQTLSSLKAAAQGQPVAGRAHAQVVGVTEKVTRDGKPYRELAVADAQARLNLRAWSDSPAFALCGTLEPGGFLEIEGEFSQHPAFGLEARQWSARPLEPQEVETLLGGPPALREKQERDFQAISALVESIADPRLRGVSQRLLEDLGERYRRAAAARTYHHARRGGLVEHVSAMMRSADKIAEVYPTLNRDLLLTGALFHDVGKLWENCPEPRGFGIPYDVKGELVGHIAIGIEIVNHLWRKMMATPEAAAWPAELHPPGEEVRMHLIHLVASHHGELAFGSPVVPKTPEAYVLHLVDNLDAKLEMMHGGYANGTPLTDTITERVRPLPGNLVQPLAHFGTA